LQNVIRDSKQFTSKKRIEAIKEHPENRRKWLYGNLVLRRKNRRANNYKLWHDGFHPVILDRKNRTTVSLYTS
jgi:hypothetical protein